MLVTERPGDLSIISNGEKKLISRLPSKEIGEGGLMGLALDPDFTSNHFIYVQYTYSGNGNDTLNRVVRYKFENNNLSDEKIIADAIPGAANHNGGRIKFGPDGFLYVTTGDAQEPSRSQDRNSLAGKILRITRDGDAASGNPFGTRVYSYGHRNPQGLAWDSSGKLYSTEHGRSGIQSGLDELNLIESGKNYGWPEIQGDETRSGMTTPLVHSGADTWAPGGAAFANGSIFFAGLRGSALYEYKIAERRIVEHFKGKYGRLREAIVGPDNMLYITTSNRDGRGSPAGDDDKIIRVNPAKI
jgi:glucose/arabinose dehydrogenase